MSANNDRGPQFASPPATSRLNSSSECATQTVSNSDAGHRNTFLEALPERDRQRVAALGTVVSVATGAVLHESRRVIHQIWFPIDCVSSLSATMEDGAEADVAIIGREGVVGVTAFLGGTDKTTTEAAVQIGGDVLRVPVDRLRDEAARSATLRLLLQRYAQALLVQATQTAACNRFHSIDQRLGRCLLTLHDRVGGDEIRMTHERLATIIGSLRPGVSLAAQRLQDQKIIRYARGHIEVLDRERLAGTSCECYELVTSEYARLLGPDALLNTGESADETLREVNSRLLQSAIREQQAREVAEQANEVNTRFFATLSHELRTPMTAILGWADLLQSHDLDQETLKVAIDTIHHAAETQRRLIDEMLDLARLRAGKLRLLLEPVDVTAAVRRAVEGCRPAADARSIAISLIAGQPVIVEADPTRVYQVVSNLLSNAVKFTPPLGTIEVTVAPHGDGVCVRVRDSGRGIESDLLPHVFERFRQGADAATGEPGMGLGLAIVQQLVGLHGGSVAVESAGAGRGSTFTVTLPRAPGV